MRLCAELKMNKLFLSLLFCTALAAQLPPVSVPNMETLRTINPVPGKPVYVEGYYTPGDGGGGMYSVTNTIANTNAFGGRVLARGGTQSWQLDTLAAYAEQFGALGNGTGSDATNINTAILWSIANQVPTYAPRTYRITNAINLPSNAVLDGLNTGQIKRAFSAAGSTSWGAVQSSPVQFVYWLNNPLQEEVQVAATNLTLKNIWVYNENPTTFINGRLVSMFGAQDVLLKNVEIGGTNAGISTDWATDFWANDVRIIDCKVQNGPGVFTDGLHIIGGRRGLIQNLWSSAGDDALAFIPPNNNILTDWIVLGAQLRSYNGYMIDFSISEVLPVASLTAPIRNIQVFGVTGEFGQRNGALNFRDKLLSGTNYTGLLNNILIDGFTATMNTNFAALGATNGSGMTVFGTADVTVRNFSITNGNNPVRLENPTRLTLDTFKYRNGSLPPITLNGGQEWTRLKGLDLEHSRASTLIQVYNSANVFIEGSRFNHQGSGGTAGPAISYKDILGYLSFSMSDSLIEGNQIGVYFDKSPRSMTFTGNTFGTNLIPKIVYNTGTARNAVTDTTGYSIGATSVTLAIGVGSGTILAGDYILFGGDTNRYTVTVGTGNVAGGPTISFTPGLVVAISTVQVGVTVVNPLTVQQIVGNSGVADSFKSGISSTFSNPVTFEAPDFSIIWTGRRADSSANMTFSMANGYPTFVGSGNWFDFTSLLGVYGRNSSVNNTDKLFNITAGNRTNSSLPIAMIRARSLETSNPVDLGGGTANSLAATSVGIWGSTNVTTATGSLTALFQLRANQTDTNNSPLILYLAGVGNTVKAAATGSRELYLGPSYSPGQLIGYLTNRTDADYTVVAGVPFIVPFESNLSVNRTVSFTTNGMFLGNRYRIVRTGVGIGTLDVGGLRTIPSATQGWVEVYYDGNGMKLSGFYP